MRAERERERAQMHSIHTGQHTTTQGAQCIIREKIHANPLFYRKKNVCVWAQTTIYTYDE